MPGKPASRSSRSKDALQSYRAKRDFAITAEPTPESLAEAANKVNEHLSFVVQKHAARRLHYDFRLELDGSLKSWAVPKGPSLDPTQKRMAVHVEDHPLAYAGFEGDIPPGQYGAGHVMVWDHGWWEPVGDPRQGYREGKLKFTLHGDKLQGGWTLVRMHNADEQRQEPWLLIKERDEQARPESEYRVVEALPDSVLGRPAPAAAATPALPIAKAAAKAATKAATKAELPAAAIKAALPDFLAPQLATLVEAPPSSGDWHYEIKFDGYRLLARLEPTRGRGGAAKVRLYTRSGQDWSERLPQLAEALAQLPAAPAWLDGEIVVAGAEGNPDFGALQAALSAGDVGRIQYFLFDLPFYRGHDLRPAPLRERRALLAALLQQTNLPAVRYSEDFAAQGSDVLHNACRLHLEGVIGKRGESRYVSRRSADWIKLRCSRRQEFVIAGYTDPKGTRSGLGALLLAVYDDDGQSRYCGRVGTGFDTATLEALRRQLDAIAAQHCPLHQPPKEAQGRDVHWVRPERVAEVSFTEWTSDGALRHPVFLGLRDDKPARQIRRETAAAAPRRAAHPAAAVSAKSSAAQAHGAADAAQSLSRLSHPERVVDAQSGATKRDVAAYYAAAAERLLPHLDDRPVALLRAPAGVAAEAFLQKHGEDLRIPGLKRLDPALDPGHPALLEIDTKEALLGAAQMNVLEFHTWNARIRRIEQPDRMVFDLDPGEGVAWQQLQEAAILVRTLLQELELQAFLKTSGGRGLHVVVPLTPKEDWDAVKDFSKAVTTHLTAVMPDRFAAKSGAKNRVGRIFVDYLRNGRGATTVAAYSLRARPGMGVSVPCAWDELSSLKGGDHWNLYSVLPRLAAADPWAAPGADYAKTRQTIKAAARKLLRS